MREVLIGAGGGLLLFLIVQGVNVMPVVFVAAIAFLLTQAPALRGTFGTRSPVTALPAADLSSTTFNDIGGQEAAKRELREALEFLREHERASHFGIRPLKGILLAGPPGTGKTLLARAAAAYTDSVFVSAAGSEFIEMYAGVGAQRVRELFRKARSLAKQRNKASAVIFIDEIEVIGGRRGQHQSHLEYDQTLNQLLVEMDGLKPDEDVKVLLLAATNRVDLLDPALLRPGRFDRTVNVELPDRAGRLAILQLHSRNKPLADTVDLDLVARETFGFSGAHLESLCNEAAILAMRDGCEEITTAHFTEATDKVILGERLDRRPQPEEMERVAVHESGHALVGELLAPGSVASVTITPRGQALGYVRSAPEADRYLQTLPQLEDQIAVLLAGAAAEEMVLGGRSTGSSGDYEQAVDLAKRIVYCGLSRLGIVDANSLPGNELHVVTSEIIQTQEERCRDLLLQHESLLREIAAELRERETMTGDELRGKLRAAAAAKPDPAAVPAS